MEKLMSYFPLIVTFWTFSAIISFLYFWPKYLLLGLIRVTFLVNGFRLRYRWVGDSKKNSWGRCRICYAERKSRRPSRKQHSHASHTAETLILLHGFTASKDVWLPVCKKIPRSVRIIAIDLPGHGGSTKPRNPSFEAYVEAMEELICHLGVKNSTLVGFSLGGPLSAILAERLPHLVSRLVLVAPAMKPPIQSEFWQMLETGKCIFLTQSVDDVHQMFKWIRYKTISLSKIFMRGLAAIRRSNYDYYLLMYEELFTDVNIKVMERIAPCLKTPTFLVWGENDLVIDKSAAVLLKNMLGSSFRDMAFLPECGHSVTIEQPALLASLLLKWQSVS